jgi:hypothetical protein
MRSIILVASLASSSDGLNAGDIYKRKFKVLRERNGTPSFDLEYVMHDYNMDIKDHKNISTIDDPWILTIYHLIFALSNPEVGGVYKLI